MYIKYSFRVYVNTFFKVAFFCNSHFQLPGKEIFFHKPSSSFFLLRSRALCAGNSVFVRDSFLKIH